MKREKMIITTSEYWDCECKENYIHHKSKTKCELCNVVTEDQPDSRLNEVIDWLILNTISFTEENAYKEGDYLNKKIKKLWNESYTYFQKLHYIPDNDEIICYIRDVLKEESGGIESGLLDEDILRALW